MLNTIVRAIRRSDLAIMAIVIMMLVALPSMTIVGAVVISNGNIPFVLSAVAFAFIACVLLGVAFIDWACE